MQRLLRILHVSDVHVNLNAVARLAELAASGHYDVVIVTGDLANYNHSTDPNAVGAESDAHNVLCGIEQGHLLPVYWLPGNHDSGRFFQAASEFKAGNRAINCHGKAGLELAPGLQICGIGGAVPATQGGYIVWEGFPLTEQQTGDLLQRVWAEQCRNPSQVLLLTHCGPDEVGTTICTLDVTQEPIHSGSTNMRRFLRQADVQRNVVAQLHGHSHDAFGMAQMGSISVINAGALKESRYGSVTLQRNAEGRWCVESASFHRLPQ